MDIYVKNKGIAVNSDITIALSELLHQLSQIKGSKRLIFERGDYYIDSSKCRKEILRITNTIGENEWKKGEIKNLTTIGIPIFDVDDLHIEGNSCQFIFDGRLSNIVLSNCNNVTISDLILSTKTPNLHELTVVKKTPFFIDYSLNKKSTYIKTNKSFSFKGRDFLMPFTAFRTQSWLAKLDFDNPNSIKRVPHPLKFALKIKELSPYNFRVSYPFSPRYKEGDRFYLFDTRRDNVGIFVNECSNIKLDKISQSFNYSLAFVAQLTKDITIKNCSFAPSEGGFALTSLADFIQLSMCSGDIFIDSNRFEGAADDALNIHGVHFKVEKIENNIVEAAFKHPQTYGFNPFKENDIVEFIEIESLIKNGEATVKKSEMIDDYKIRLTLDNTANLTLKHVIDNASRAANLYFTNNYINRIITRGLLITTKGRVVIMNNNFNNTHMHSIFINDDAEGWYESSYVENVDILNNVFNECKQSYISIKPENSVYKGAVHKNIRIENNEFVKDLGIFIRSSDNVRIANNKTANKEIPLDVKDTTNLHYL